MNKSDNKNKFIRLPEVMQRTSLSRSSIYLRCATGTMPKPCSLGGRAVGWVESEIEEYLESLIAASRKTGSSDE